MQDDRALTFRQIHGNKESLLSAVEDVERIALVESYELGPLWLRFLEPYPQSQSEFDYILTPAREIRIADSNSYDYITVSYVWNHPQPVEGIKTPEYRVWDGTDLKQPPRLLRCPEIVFHRAVQFTKAEKLERIWIDQECIDQNDSNDVEKHLQDMHRIYRFSRMTVAVLSTVSNRWMHLPSHFDTVETLSQTAGEMLQAMVDDTWFTRSWTFHEQHCAADLVYLLPTPPSRSCHASRKPGIKAKTRFLTPDNDILIYRTALSRFFYLCERMGQDLPAVKPFFVEHGHAGLVSTDVPGAIETVQKKVDKRANRVLSDRLQIIANVCGLGWKLKTTLLNNPTQSYSTCLLALTMANTWPDTVERALMYQELGDTFLNGDIGVMLEGLKGAEQSDLWRLPGFR